MTHNILKYFFSKYLYPLSLTKSPSFGKKSLIKKAVHHEFVRPSHLLILELNLYFLISFSTLMDSMMYKSFVILLRKSSFLPTLEESMLM